MSTQTHVIYLLMLAAIVVAVFLGAGEVYQRGYEVRGAEEEARRKWVARQMADVGLCAWLDQVEYDEECTRRKAHP